MHIETTPELVKDLDAIIALFILEGDAAADTATRYLEIKYGAEWGKVALAHVVKQNYEWASPIFREIEPKE